MTCVNTYHLGANVIDPNLGMVQFGVFAYRKKQVDLILKDFSRQETRTYQLPMKEVSPNYYFYTAEGISTNSQYMFYLDGEGPFPDPRSEYQPEGVHGFSQVVNHYNYLWNDNTWEGTELSKMIIYELHIGTFTSKGSLEGSLERNLEGSLERNLEGSFLRASKKLDYLKELGVNTIELMPINQTPGRWNWGYDGTGLFSVNCNYGTPEDLKHLVDLCHQKGIAVILDVVYNHFGPEGTYLRHFGPYFTKKHQTPWGEAVNYDDEYCEVVRQMVTDSIKHWVENYHFDGFRLDAVHTIKDESSPHILKEIAITAKQVGEKHNKPVWVIAETDENDVRLIAPLNEGGYEIDAQWMDDFHHCVHTTLTGENQGYYIDYGRFSDLEKVLKNYLYTGEYSLFWKKKRGTDGSSRPGSQFVVAIQTHDQVGNRARGDRLSQLVNFPYLKAAAGLLFFSPYLPLLFMGEEYGEENPFLFFTDYTDPELQTAVSRGRRKEFKDFDWEEVPDPQEKDTFYSSLLTKKENWKEQQHFLFNYYRDLIKLRQKHPVLRMPNRDNTRVNAYSQNQVLEISRHQDGLTLIGLFNLGHKIVEVKPYPGKAILSSEWEKYGGRKDHNHHRGLTTLKNGEALIWQL